MSPLLLLRSPAFGRWLAVAALVSSLTFVVACPDRPDQSEPSTPTPDGDAGQSPEPTVIPPTGCDVDGVAIELPRTLPSVATGAPDLSCATTPEVFAASTNVTAQGCVDIFGIGGNARAGLTIAFFGIDQDPSSDTPAHGDVEIAVTSQAGPLQDLAAACPKNGYYRIPNIPTHVPLIIKVFESITGPQQIAIPSYTYGIVLYDRDAVDGAVDYEASLIYKSTYDSIPTLGGQRIDGQQIIYDGEGRGVIAGEARDCNKNVLENATISTSELDLTTKVVYFNGDLDDPSPDLGELSTNEDGLYAILNVATDDGVNMHTIAAAIVDRNCSGDDCQCLKLGAKMVRTFPDSVTLVSFDVPYPVIDPDFVVDAGPDVDAGEVDAGEVDAGEVDAGEVDAGEVDAGVTDAGVTDAGEVDAGVTDAGVTDAGVVDAG